MTLPLVFLPAARAEFDAAGDWYEQRRAGLGAAFTAAVGRILSRIADQPNFYAPVYDGIREALVSGYPYCVYYRESADRVVVLSIFHTSRDPSVWRRRA